MIESLARICYRRRRRVVLAWLGLLGQPYASVEEDRVRVGLERTPTLNSAAPAPSEDAVR